MNPNAPYDLLCAAVPGTESADEVIIGLTWTLVRAGRHAGLAMSPAGATRTLPWSGTLAGRRLAELAQWVRSWDPWEASIGMAAINCALNRDPASLPGAEVVSATPGRGNLAPFEHFAPRCARRRSVVIGRYPGLAELPYAQDMLVLERTPGAGDLPDPAAEFVLPQCNWAFVTASSLANKTFPRLAELAGRAELVLMGPGTPWLPALRQFGVDWLAGCEVVDVEALRRTVAEGGGTRIFEGPVRYFCAKLTDD